MPLPTLKAAKLERNQTLTGREDFNMNRKTGLSIKSFWSTANITGAPRASSAKLKRNETTWASMKMKNEMKL